MEIQEIRDKLNELVVTRKDQAKEIKVDYTNHTRFLNGLPPSKEMLRKYKNYINKLVRSGKLIRQVDGVESTTPPKKYEFVTTFSLEQKNQLAKKKKSK